MPRATRQMALLLSRVSGAQRLCRLRSKGPTVLFYHGVEEKHADPVVQSAHMPLRVFEQQLRFIRREREVIGLDALHEHLASGRRLDHRHIVITFDDGYTNNLRIVAPLLHSWNLPFTIFVSTRHISEHRRFPWYYMRVAVLFTDKTSIDFKSVKMSFGLATREMRVRAARSLVEAAKRMPLSMVETIVEESVDQLSPNRWAELNAQFSSEEPMSWHDLFRARALGATIGSHCHDHCILHSRQTDKEVYRQLDLSKAAVEQKVAECRYFAYPNGTADDVSRVAYAAVKSRFRMAFTTIRGEMTPDCDYLLAPRLFALSNYEEFCYLLNTSGRQNAVYSRDYRRCEAATACLEKQLESHTQRQDVSQ